MPPKKEGKKAAKGESKKETRENGESSAQVNQGTVNNNGAHVQEVPRESNR